MENRFLESITKSLQVELPQADIMDDYIDEMLPRIRPWSEDLRETHFYLNKPWLEFRDDENFHEAILHFFNEGGEYLRSVDGNYKVGQWRYMEGSNKLLITMKGSSGELFDLAFMDNRFLILDKHGDQHRLGEAKYLVLMYEPLGKRLMWREAMELLYNSYRNSSGFYVTVAVIVVLILMLFLIFY